MKVFLGYDLRHGETCLFCVSDQILHKPGFTTTIDSSKLEMTKEDEGFYNLISKNESVDQLHRSYRADDLRLCCRICRSIVFL